MLAAHGRFDDELLQGAAILISGLGAELAEAARALVDDLSGKLVPLNIVLRGEAPPDLFVLALTVRTYLVSDRLATGLAESGMTGFRLERCPG